MAVDATIVPADEHERLRALRRYDVLDTPPDGAFERLTTIAARHFGVPISIISLVDEDRIWFKSARGLPGTTEIDRAPGLCASAILQDDVWVVERADVDPRTLANPLVAGELGLRFYAGAPLTTPDGHKLGTICVIDRVPREVTADEVATLADLASIVVDELELRLAARRNAELLEQTRSDFVVTAAHELRTPLAAIYGAAKTLGNSAGKLPELERQLVEMISSSSDRLSETVDKLLTAAQLDEGELTFASEIVDPAAVARSAVDSIVGVTTPGRVQLTLREPLPSVRADSVRLRQVLVNLVENAVKYSPHGGRVELEVEARPGEALFRVSDEGIGIAEADQRRVFDKFVRVDPMLERGTPGTGLGLYIARSFVERMGGSIAVSSSPGRGSTFLVAVPAAD